ncbi:MAG: protein-disulfide reductase DsbD domain-containing protein [Planctomycetota bacterium]|jgi:thiol:disulfide interchange protein DsbD
MKHLFLTLCTVLALGSGPAAAQFEFGQTKSADQLVKVRALAETSVIHPGQTVHLAVSFDIEPGWHIYWINAGSSGLPTQIDVMAPKGFEVGQTLYPRPGMHRGPEGVSFGYEKRTVLFVPVTAPAELPEGEVSFKLSMTWLVCKRACLMGDAEKTVTLRADSSAAPADAGQGPKDSLLREFKEQLPRSFEKLAGAELDFDGSTLVLSGPAGELAGAQLFPIELPGVTYGAARTTIADGRFEVRVPVTVKPGNSLGKPMALRGVVALGERPEDPCYEFNRPISADGR